jgi:Cysteine-rich domain
LCCGSAGTYNILEPEIAARLRDRKIANIVQTSPDIVATGNIGCIAQIASGTSVPVLHTIELLDFAHSGPTPDGLARLTGRHNAARVASLPGRWSFLSPAITFGHFGSACLESGAWFPQRVRSDWRRERGGQRWRRHKREQSPNICLI